MLPDSLTVAWHFCHARWLLKFKNREALENWQRQKLSKFLGSNLKKVRRFQGENPSALDELACMDKNTMMQNFQSYNTEQVALSTVLPIATQAENSRDFAPMYKGLTVGLSSGTSGNRGVFLISRKERLRWAGIILAQAMPTHLLRQALSPWRPPVKIAFFLRANSNLYTTLSSKRIDFSFYDLLLGADASIASLNRYLPDVLVGPPFLLRELAAAKQAGLLQISPSHIISVAEVLEPKVKKLIEKAFTATVQQIYQATEGFLGYTCEQGSLHLNERFVHIEPEWLDNEKTRFQPIVTDFTRTTQLIVRYRLNDILRASKTPCACGRAERTIAAIAGRSDEVLWLPAINTANAIAIYPDSIRRLFLFIEPEIHEFSVKQISTTLLIGILTAGSLQQACARITTELFELCERLQAQQPVLEFAEWQPPAPGAKRRRVQVLKLPDKLQCTF